MNNSKTEAFLNNSFNTPLSSQTSINTIERNRLKHSSGKAMKKKVLSIINVIGLLCVTAITGSLGQNCGCSSDLCCSQYGYCGLGDPYCGTGCQEGPCYSGSFSVGNLVTDGFFNNIINQAASSCAGKSFYTRGSFISALDSYTQFGQMSTSDDSKREVAAFFAHVTHETGHMCYIDEIDGPTKNYCDPNYPCPKSYYGRGPLQLTWNYNYQAAGNANGFDGINSPETVGQDALLSFKVSLWYWMNNVHSVVTQGFGATIKAINSIECNGGNAAAVQARIQYYQDYCNQFGVSSGDNLSC